MQCLVGEWDDVTADDLYALFAGGQVEHDQIAVVETGLAAAVQEQNIERLGQFLAAWDESHDEGARSLGAHECWKWYLGRRLLAHFNPLDLQSPAADDADE